MQKKEKNSKNNKKEYESPILEEVSMGKEGEEAITQQCSAYQGVWDECGSKHCACDGGKAY